MKNKDINMIFCKEYPTAEKLTKYNAYNQEFIQKKMENDFLLAQPDFKKYCLKKNMSIDNMDKLARYQEY